MRLIEVRRTAMAPGQPELQAVLETQQTWLHIGLLGSPSRLLKYSRCLSTK